ncbi:hypothetical protein [Antribacter gilvus]|uniref:hypothetical protein n=1 Tax=Antribacter gilvus TaxID=2304675 RepID=UPI000F7A2995|nr:hypothetical protein [Antribacter gilvus]
MIVLVDPAGDGLGLSAAFREEGAECVHVYSEARKRAYDEDPAALRVLHDDLESTVRILRDLGARVVVAAHRGGPALADELAEALGLDHHDPCRRAARADGAQTLSVLRTAGVAHLGLRATRTVVGLTGLDEDEPGCVPASLRGWAGGDRYVVSTVSLSGSHLVTEVMSARVDLVAGVPVLRHLLASDEAGRREQEVVSCALAGLDALGVREGPAHTEVLHGADGPRLVRTSSSLIEVGRRTDPFHAALGYSHRYLTVERYLRPREFERRLGHGYQPRAAVGVAYLRERGEGRRRSADGLRSLRRMPGFHSVVDLPVVGTPQVRQEEPARQSIAYFVHEDGALVAHVLASLHEIEDSGDLVRTPSAIR